MKYVNVISVAAATILALTTGCTDDTLLEPAPTPSAPQYAAPNDPPAGAFSAVKLIAPAQAYTTSAIIGPRGGSLYDHVNDNELKVYPNAVREDVHFTMVTIPGDEARVELTAVRVSDGVEITQFQREIKLYLSWKNVPGANPSRLRIAHVQSDGALDPQETAIDRKNRTAFSKLFHFSAYVLASD